MRMMMTIVCLTGVLWAAIGQAYPTLTGATGMGTLPTADTVGTGVVQVAADYYASGSGSYPLRALAGIGSAFELGVAYTPGSQFIDDRTRLFPDYIVVDGVQQQDMLGATAKLQLPWRLLDGNLALGGLYASGDLRLRFVTPHTSYLDTIGEVDTSQVYLVLTRPFTPCDDLVVIRGSLGVNWTEVKRELNQGVAGAACAFAGTHDAVRVFAGVDVNVFDLLVVAAEVQTESGALETDALYSIVARYTASPHLSAQLGFTNAAGVLGTPNTNLFLGATYNFGRLL